MSKTSQFCTKTYVRPHTEYAVNGMVGLVALHGKGHLASREDVAASNQVCQCSEEQNNNKASLTLKVSATARDSSVCNYEAGLEIS